MLVISLAPGSDKSVQQEDASPYLQMQTNPCYAVTNQGPVEDREEDSTVDGHIHEVQMVENPSYAYIQHMYTYNTVPEHLLT